MFTKTVILALGLFYPSLTFAHSGGDHIDGFLSGVHHPFFGVDHLLAIIAVGAISALTGGRGGIIAPLAFMAAMVAGIVLGLGGIGLPYLEAGVAFSLVAFGAMVGHTKTLPVVAAVALTTLFGLFHGNAHGFEVPEGASGGAYATGIILGTYALILVGRLSASKLARWPGTIRAAGIATSMIGLTLATQTI